MFQIKIKTLLPHTSTQIQHSNTTQTNHNLNFPLLNSIRQCEYKNQVNFEKILVDNDKNPKIKIINQLCTQKGNMLQKVTSIKFGDQIITIKDLYNFQTLGTKLQPNVGKKRVLLFKKNIKLDENSQLNKTRITKNLPKNFIKAFLNYLEYVKNQNNKQLIQCKLKMFILKEKFNNTLIKKIIDDQKIESFFKDFLKNYAEQWIINSKIINKKTHLNAIPIFLNLKSENNKFIVKPEQTNSNQRQNQQNLSYNNSQNQQLFALVQKNSQRDSILANESVNYCFHDK